MLLRAWRGKRSQQTVAAELGMQQNRVSRLETGRVTPRLVEAVAIEELTKGRVPFASWTEPAPE